MKPAIASNEREAKMKSSSGDNAIRHIRDDTPGNIFNNIGNGSIHRSDGQTSTRIEKCVAEALKRDGREFLPFN